jgi:Tfp pilus assembly protein PilN
MRAFNLIPADERSGAGLNAGKSGGSAFVVLGVLGVLAIFALLYGHASRQISSQTAKIATLNTQAQAAQAQAARLAPYVSFMTMHEQRVQAVDQLVDSRFDWAHAFHELGRVLPPEEVALTSLSGTIGSGSGTGSTAAGADTAAGASSKAAAATGATTTTAAGSSSAATASSTSVASATPPGSVPTFTLSGCATTQAMVALTLERLRLIDGVSEVTLQSSTQTPKSGSGGSSSSGSGSCKGPVFAMQITFDPLPSASATSSPRTAPTETASALTPATGSPTTSTGGVR